MRHAQTTVKNHGYDVTVWSIQLPTPLVGAHVLGELGSIHVRQAQSLPSIS